jgi:hypothetical protein
VFALGICVCGSSKTEGRAVLGKWSGGRLRLLRHFTATVKGTIMKVKKSTKFFCLFIALLSLSAQGRFVLTEHEIEEFRDESSGWRYHPSAVCTPRNGDGLFILTHCILLPDVSGVSSPDNKDFLWKIDPYGTVLWKTCLKEDKDRSFSFAPWDQIMMIATPDHLLVVNTPNRHGMTEPAHPVSYQFSLPNAETGDPNLLILTAVGDPFEKSLCMLCLHKLSPLHPASFLLFARDKGMNRDIFLRTDPFGNVMQSIPIFDPWVEICDYAVSPDEGAIAVVARKQMRGETGRFWEYSAGFLNTDGEHLLQTDIFQSDVYGKGDNDMGDSLVAQELRPKIAALKDHSFLYLYSSPLDHEQVSVRMRLYSPDFEFLKEKEILRLDCGFIEGFPTWNTLDTAIMDDTHVVLAIGTKGRLSFWVFDLKGNLKVSKHSAEKQKMIFVYGLFSLQDSVAAVVSEKEIPVERPITKESYAKTKETIKLYSLRKK